MSAPKTEHTPGRTDVFEDYMGDMSAPEFASKAEQRRFENQAKYGCDYCCAIGACPRCWGRAAIDELKHERDRLLAEKKELVEALEKIAALQNSDTADLRDGSIIIRNQTSAIARAVLAKAKGE